MNGGLGNDGSPQKPLGAAPKSRTCYICGRMYGTSSYEIHLKQCKQLWIDREAQKDPRERKPLPEDPFANGGFSPAKPRRNGGGSGGSGNEGEEEGGNYEEGGRQLTLEEMNNIAGAAFNTAALDACQFCGRTFLPEKLKIHNRSCTAESPARRVSEAVRSGHDPVNVSDAKIHHKRPSSQGGARLQEVASPTPADDDTLHLRVSNGSLVGSIGGPSGRPLRKQNQTNKVSQSTDNVFGMPNLDNKEEVMNFLASKIVNLEASAATILQELDEVKTMMSTLMMSSGNSESSGIAG